jgi:hypothetical protein
MLSTSYVGRTYDTTPLESVAPFYQFDGVRSSMRKFITVVFFWNTE